MHTIHNIAFEVGVNHDDGLVSWEEYYVDFFKKKLLPRMESICDDWDRKYPNTKCTINTIDINVEVAGLNLEELQKEIIQQINQQLASIQTDGSSSDGKTKAVLTRETSTFDALVKYLSNGILPAYIPIKTFKEWLGNIVEFDSIEKAKLNALFAKSSETIERMLSLLRNDYAAFSALIEIKQQITSQYIRLEATFFKQFLKAVYNGFQLEYTDENANIWYKTLETSSSLAQFSKTFLQLLQPKVQSEGNRLTNSSERYISIALLQAIVQDKMGKELTIPISKIGKVVKDATITSQKDTKNALTGENEQNATETEATKGTKPVIKEALQTEIQKDQTVSKVENSTDQEQHQADEKVIGNNEKEVQQTTTESANILGKTTDVVENTTTNHSEPSLAKAKKESIGDVTLTTEKSGLILLHPFLTTFFKGVNLVTDANEIKDVEKACMLLHYLATENEEATDVELTLEKILLGIPLETIIDCQTPLTTEEKALCEELLQAVLTHWVVLKKSTINTLRDMFLMRDGHITITEESIKLKIERLAQDILLEKVPWNISLFRLKWMEKMVHIEW